MRPEVITDGSVSSLALVWRQRARVHLTIVAKAVFEVTPDGVAAYRAPGMLPRSPMATGEPAYRPRCDVTMVGGARPVPGTTDPFVRLGIARDGRIVLDKTARAPFTALAPLSAEAPERASLLSPAARAGLERDPAEIVDEFVWDYFQAAPADQRVELLTGGEWLVLDGVDPHAARVVTKLPAAGPEARVRVVGGDAASHDTGVPMRCDTVAVDAARLEITIVWRGVWALPAGVTVADCRVAIGLAAPERAIAWTELWARIAPRAEAAREGSPDDSTYVLRPTAVEEAAVPVVLPFATIQSAAASVLDSTQPGGAASLFDAAPFPLAAASKPSTAASLTGLPWGGPVKAVAAPKPGDETIVLGRAPTEAPVSPLAARLREMAKDKDAVRKLMASLRAR